jgi:hypothetical protein
MGFGGGPESMGRSGECGRGEGDDTGATNLADGCRRLI